MKKINRIALIAGNGNFPLFLAKAARANGVEVVAIAINSETKKNIEELTTKTYWVNLGEAKRLLDILKKEAITYAIMAGKITKTTLFKQGLKLDEEARRFFKRLVDRRDNTLLAAVAARLKEFGVELIDSTTFVKGMMPSKGVLTRHRPNKDEYEDINFGFKIAKDMGRLDIGQSVIIKDKAVIAVEAIEGTDEAIIRGGILGGENTVVVKVAKPNQDMRFDVPVVGLHTIESLKKSGSKALAIEADSVLVLEREEIIKEADKHGIAIVAI